MIEALIAAGAELEAPSDAGTPLLWAAGSGAADAVAALLQAGAGPNAVTEGHVSAVCMATASGAGTIPHDCGFNRNQAGLVLGLQLTYESGFSPMQGRGQTPAIAVETVNDANMQMPRQGGRQAVCSHAHDMSYITSVRGPQQPCQ